LDTSKHNTNITAVLEAVQDECIKIILTIELGR